MWFTELDESSTSCSNDCRKLGPPVSINRTDDPDVGEWARGRRKTLEGATAFTIGRDEATGLTLRLFTASTPDPSCSLGDVVADLRFLPRRVVLLSDSSARA